MKRVLITAGQVYGMLDDNKLVGNRSRGIWAVKLADTLAMMDFAQEEEDGLEYDFQITLLVPDTFPKERIEAHINRMAIEKVTVVKHRGFDDYREKCHQLAGEHDYAIMASAVVNWIPTTPVPGKMATKGYKVGDKIDISFYLAPRVIEEMKLYNPTLTIIGCKMLAGADDETLVEAAYGVLRRSKCNVVVANDLTAGLRRKLLVYPDRSVHEYDNDWPGFEKALCDLLQDRWWKTIGQDEPVGSSPAIDRARLYFDQIVDKYRDRFLHPVDGKDMVFGSLAVPVGKAAWLVSPRTKGKLFTSKDAVLIQSFALPGRTIHVRGLSKATLNAPLLIRTSAAYDNCAVLHLHEEHPMGVTVPYGPPGSERDNSREIVGPVMNIEGHGFVATLNEDLWMQQ